MTYCDYCPGYCCYRLPGSVLLVNAEDINRLARHLKISDGEVRRQYLENRYTFKVKDNGACIFQSLDRLSKRCSIHEARPGQCRRFPYDSPCPYLERDDLLDAIQPLLEKELLRQ